jgi:hypothetical protein
MVAGIIVVAAGDQLVLRNPGVVGQTAVSVMLLGGTALYLLGHAGFKAVIWGGVPWTRIGGVVVMAALGGLAPYLRGAGRSGRGRRRLPAPRRPPPAVRDPEQLKVVLGIGSRHPRPPS